jgi:hypothetical protein
MSSYRPQAEQPRPAPARRVSLQYKSGSWSIVSARKTPPTILPASESLTPKSAHTQSGAWCELADGRGRLVYRRFIYDLYGQIGEEFEKGRPVALITEPRERVVSLLVPNLPEGGRLHLYSSPPLSPSRAEKAEAGARRVASFDLPPEETEHKR